MQIYKDLSSPTNQKFEKLGLFIEQSVQKHPRNSDAEFIEHIRKLRPRWSQNPSLDAERHRRTPRLLAISGGAICRGLWAWAVADSMSDAGRNWPQWR